jgi:hypothetical protein
MRTFRELSSNAFAVVADRVADVVKAQAEMLESAG